jgi:inhibitor of Bruton tyrosine kinase
MLDCLTSDLVKQLGESVRRQQTSQAPVSRMGSLIEEAMERYKDWLALQDIPQPFIPSSRLMSLRPSPHAHSKAARRPSGPSFLDVPGPALTNRSCDDVFIMDDMNGTTTHHTQASFSEDTPSPSPAWKGVSTAPRCVVDAKSESFLKVFHYPRVDMKAIMEEAASSRLTQTQTSGSSFPHTSTVNDSVRAK